MGRIVVMNHVTLDGVMQGPGRADEDTRGGFTQGGWGNRSATPDDAAGKAMGERMAAGAAWQDGCSGGGPTSSCWPPGTPGAARQGRAQRHAQVRRVDHSQEPLPWPNSTLLRGDIVEALRALKAQSGGVLAIMGSGVLIGSLMAANLIDEYLLMIHPLVLGTGRRLFPGGVNLSLRLTGSIATTTGVVIATYEPVSDSTED